MKQHYVSIAVLILLILLAYFLPEANAHPLPAQDKEIIATIRNEGHISRDCKIYRIKINDNYYIVNTCGGIVAESPIGKGTSE